ncbi:MAG: hypothetical protein J6A48_06230 [Clostridia bacterium]|nr:hypothetical protein [Clostridia bacterium]
MAVFFHFVFILRCQSHITYTVTAGLLGAAAVAQLMSIDSPNCTCGQWIRSALLSLVLILFSYCLRQQAMLPSLVFCLLAFAVQGIRRHTAGQEWFRPLLCTFLIVALSLGLVMGLRSWEINTKPGIREYMDWQDARIQIWDYLGIGNVPAGTMEEYDISEARKALYHDWYQMDGDLDTETLLALGDAIKAGRINSFEAQMQRMNGCITGLFETEPVTVRSLWVLASLILCTAAFLCISKKRGKTAIWIALLLGTVIAVGLTLYLAYQGRLNLRGFLTILLPLAALIICCLPHSLSQDNTAAGKVVGALTCVVLLLGCTMYAIPFLQSHLRRPPTEKELATETVLAAMDEYAVENEDYLLIYDGTLAIDMRMFPPTENGIPKNLHLWGGWNLHSPSYNAMLENYSFDADTWSVEDFLSYDVRFLRRNAAAPALLMDVLNETTQVECYLETEWDGVYVMFFEEW